MMNRDGVTSKSSTHSRDQCSTSSRQLGAVVSAENAGTSTSSGISAPAMEKKSRKRKSEESPERLRKRSKKTPYPSKDLSHQTSTESSKKSRKRKSEESPERPRKRSKKTPYPSMDLSHQTSTESSKNSRKRKSEESPERPRKRSRKSQSSSKNMESSGPSGTKDDFEAKYTQQRILGRGGFGKVYAGYRNEDNLPVAIKRINFYGRTGVRRNGKTTFIPTEVALLLHLKPDEGKTSAVVSLLDWYQLDHELILVLERPDPCIDLFKYVRRRKSSMPEDEVKILIKQLLDCLIDVHSRGVFHRDIKLENILIETGSNVPRVRLIDFGCGTFLTKERFSDISGTLAYSSPEMFRRGWYTPEATSVWQLGVMLYEMLHDTESPFDDIYQICHSEPDLRWRLSSDCIDFLQNCLIKRPEERATLETLKHHPWLQSNSWSSIFSPASLRATATTFFESMKATLLRMLGK